jgi:hypothetical protein
VSGHYSGCVFRVFRKGKAFVCMHIYNPGSDSSLLEAADRYIQAVGGEEIATIGSTGPARGGKLGTGIDSVWFVCELHNDRVAISRLEVQPSGKVARQTSGVFPGINFELLTLSR